MGRKRFIIVGSGWRSQSYVRIAKALPEHFELGAMLCRSQEKADKMSAEHDIYTTTSIKECMDMAPDCVNLSLAHEYHGARLMRAILGENADAPFTVSAKSYKFPVVETLSRYEKFTDGRISEKKRTVATFEFGDGKVCWYDFDSEKYRSPIRRRSVTVQGVRGEIRDDNVWFVDADNEPQQGRLVVAGKITVRESDNPNLKILREVEKITLETTLGTEQVIYEAEFGMCGLSEDDTAIAMIMRDIDSYGEAELKEALQDCYMAILMEQAVESGQLVSGEEQIWNRG